ncbi:hypothetical protein CPB85DRAFT_1323198 [Mucidula mucida]|nr:hypothetical protein CPB85DRAFT_1323198 [Mucidula mucida]
MLVLSITYVHHAANQKHQYPQHTLVVQDVAMLTLEAFLKMVDDGHKTICSLGTSCHWRRFPDFDHFYHEIRPTVPANSTPFPLDGVDTPFSDWADLRDTFATSTHVHIAVSGKVTQVAFVESTAPVASTSRLKRERDDIPDTSMHGQSHQCTSTRAPSRQDDCVGVPLQVSMSASTGIALLARVTAFGEPCAAGATRGGLKTT